MRSSFAFEDDDGDMVEVSLYKFFNGDCEAVVTVVNEGEGEGAMALSKKHVPHLKKLINHLEGVNLEEDK